MDSIIFYATTRENALKAVTVMTQAIKAREDAAHKLFFASRLMGEYDICRGTVDADGKRQLVGDHEIIFFPASREQDLERLKAVKTVVDCHNCMWICGDSEEKIHRVQYLIDWLLTDDMVYS